MTLSPTLNLGDLEFVSLFFTQSKIITIIRFFYQYDDDGYYCIRLLIYSNSSDKIQITKSLAVIFL